MNHHVIVLPDDIFQTITTKINGDATRGDVTQTGLRFLRLPHPRTGLSALFLPHELPDKSVSVMLEVQAVAPPNPRSWFMPEGEVLKDGQLLLLTPIDPVFLLIPLLKCSCPYDDTPSSFRSAEDLFEAATSTFLKTMGSDESSEPASHTLDDLLRLLSYQCIDSAMKRICEVKEITAEIVVYRYSHEKTIHYLKAKVRRLSAPTSCEISATIIRQLARDGLMDDGKEELLDLARTKAACELLSQYLLSDLYADLLKQYDFAALNTHLIAIQAEQTAIAESSAPAPKARKAKAQNQKSDAAEKKRKAASKSSNGVEKLKKANVKGMAKISSFFQKPPQ
ncbi:hypothetical protein DAEQUDRAFT_688381 [Daedalea quercina L-15889]|uniref:Ribonuclease H2 subunit B n=1 Tax=Daedalea quercina L-15889 TaxID=1314783 RepID=A0A165RNX2_9APHY|nr:hypothetical protein DAEQUDRAFT_688381 [Daedalea quercina L-15889]